MNWQGIKSVLVALEGTLMQGNEAITGAGVFVERVRASGRQMLVITNHARFAPEEIRARLTRASIPVQVGEVYTAGMATATFLRQQWPGGKAFVVGSGALCDLIQQAGYVLSAEHPDYVVLGDPQEVSLAVMTQAIRLVQAGMRCIMTNPEPRASDGTPATGAIGAFIHQATGVKLYCIGKPNPLFLRLALRTMEGHAASSVLFGDQMETDIISGIEAGMPTVLVLTGSTHLQHMTRLAYQPTLTLPSIATALVDLTPS